MNIGKKPAATATFSQHVLRHVNQREEKKIKRGQPAIIERVLCLESGKLGLNFLT